MHFPHKEDQDGLTPSVSTKFMARKCYGSTMASKPIGRGSIPWRVTNILKGDEA